MLKLLHLQLCDLSLQLFIFILSQLIKPRSLTNFTELLSNKQCCLLGGLQKDYLQINAFLANGGRIKKNLKVL